MRVVFSKIAEFTRDRIIEFLADQWTQTEIEIFLDDIEILKKNLEEEKFLMYQFYSRNIRSALIGQKHVRVYFKKQKNEINVLLFFDTREDPQKLSLFLNQ